MKKTRLKKKISQKKVSSHWGRNILIMAAIIAVIPLLKYTNFQDKPVALHKAAPLPPKASLTMILPINDIEFSIAGNGERKMVKTAKETKQTYFLDQGAYTIEFNKKFGFRTPEPKSVTLETGKETVLLADYYPDFGAPIVGIKIFPEFGVYRITNKATGEKIEKSGSDFFTMPAGDYLVEFLEEGIGKEYYSTPGGGDLILKQGANLTINAAYGEKKAGEKAPPARQ